MKRKSTPYLLLVLLAVLAACNHPAKKKPPVIYKGVYSFGPEVKTFRDCDSGNEYWVTDHSSQLELKYSELKFEKPYEPVYVEVEGKKIKSARDGLGSEYDSTLVVEKLVKISKVIPPSCN